MLLQKLLQKGREPTKGKKPKRSTSSHCDQSVICELKWERQMWSAQLLFRLTSISVSVMCCSSCSSYQFQTCAVKMVRNDALHHRSGARREVMRHVGWDEARAPSSVLCFLQFAAFVSNLNGVKLVLTCWLILSSRPGVLHHAELQLTQLSSVGELLPPTEPSRCCVLL